MRATKKCQKGEWNMEALCMWGEYGGGVWFVLLRMRRNAVCILFLDGTWSREFFLHLGRRWMRGVRPSSGAAMEAGSASFIWSGDGEGRAPFLKRGDRAGRAAFICGGDEGLERVDQSRRRWIAEERTLLHVHHAQLERMLLPVANSRGKQTHNIG